MQTKQWTRSHTLTVLMVLLFLAIMVFGCTNKPLKQVSKVVQKNDSWARIAIITVKPYTLRINGNDSSFTLMDGNREVSTFTDEKLDSIVLEDNQ